METSWGGGRGDGGYGGRWDGGRGSGAGCVGSFRGFRLVGDEVGEGVVVLAPGLGGRGPCRGRGRHAGVVVPYGWLRKVSSTILGRGLAAEAAWRPGGWWGPPVGEGSRMGAFVPVLRPREIPRRGRAPSWFPALAAERMKSFFPATCAAGKILLTERSVKRVRPLWGSDPFCAKAEREAPPAVPEGPRPSCRHAARGFPRPNVPQYIWAKLAYTCLHPSGRRVSMCRSARRIWASMASLSSLRVPFRER